MPGNPDGCQLNPVVYLPLGPVVVMALYSRFGLTNSAVAKRNIKHFGPTSIKI